MNETFQPGFCSNHSTETALVHVVKCLRLSADAQSPFILVLLDLIGAVFGTVDHMILIYLEYWEGTVLLSHHLGHLSSWVMGGAGAYRSAHSEVSQLPIQRTAVLAQF